MGGESLNVLGLGGNCADGDLSHALPPLLEFFAVGSVDDGDGPLLRDATSKVSLQCRELGGRGEQQRIGREHVFVKPDARVA